MRFMRWLIWWFFSRSKRPRKTIKRRWVTPYELRRVYPNWRRDSVITMSSFRSIATSTNEP